MGQAIRPRLDNFVGSPLPSHVRTLLMSAFSDYQRVIIKTEMGSGFSDSRMFLVRPIRKDSGTELPVIVKIGSVSLIKQEWKAYQTHLRHRLPAVAEIIGEPTFPPGIPFGCLRYALVGSGLFTIETLFNYYRSASAADITYLLEESLFRRMETMWKYSTLSPEYSLLYGYDDLLPFNLAIEVTDPSTVSSAQWLNPDIAHGYTLNVGDDVILSGFRIVEIIHNINTLILNSPQEAKPFHIRLQFNTPISDYEFGQVIDQPIYGIVQDTRTNYLIESVTASIGHKFDLTANFLPLESGDVLPNPLVSLPKVLNSFLDARVSSIHGDLNLESVLVEPENRNVYLIDFVHAHKNHVLRDLIRLEVDVITRLIPETLTTIQLSPQSIHSFLERLHCAVLHPGRVASPIEVEKAFATLLTIRKTAQNYLFRTGDWREYYLGLFIHLLGTFKYHGLDLLPTAPYPKQTAFWAAATTIKLLETEISCADVIDSNLQGASRASSEMTIRQEYLVELLRILQTRFDREELRTLCFYLNVNYDDLPTESRSEKARELLAYLQRANRISELTDVVKSMRPNISWRAVSDADKEAFTIQDETHTTLHGPVTGPIHTGSGDIAFTITTRFDSSDSYSGYETGVQRLLDELGQDSSLHDKVQVIQQRLNENISRTRRFGDTSFRQSERAEIIEMLNDLSLQALGVSFNELCT